MMPTMPLVSVVELSVNDIGPSFYWMLKLDGPWKNRQRLLLLVASA
jgi:hypothetical protein